MAVFFRHERVRPHQEDLLSDAYNILKTGGLLLAHAPTGLGKTDAVLGAALSVALEEDLTVFFLTPKISQHRIAVEVVRGLAQKHELKIRAVDLIGRKHACLDANITSLDHDGFYMQCEKKRKKGECVYHTNARGSGKLEEARSAALVKRVLEEYGTAMTHSELMKIAAKEMACPYELSLRIGESSTLVIGDYTHLFIPSIREPLLKKMRKRVDRSIVIVDEAHNLGKRVREHLSVSVNSFMLKRAEKEMASVDAEVLPLLKPFEEWAAERLKEQKEMVVSQLGFSNLLASYGMDVPALAAHFEDLGFRFVEKTNRKSACMRIANFIAAWGLEEEGSIRVLRKGGEFFSLSKRMLDPSIATKMLNDSAGAVLMSGTLRPLQMHRDVLGLDPGRTEMRAYPSPFSADSAINIIAEGMTTRFTRRDFENYTNMAGTIDRLINSTPGGVAVFFASYAVQNAVVPLMKTEGMLVQQESMGPRDVDAMLSAFRAGGGVLCGVQGGSLSEGVDYPNGEIKTAIVVGVALDEKGLEVDALIDYYEEKFGKGWEYGYLFPAVIKGVQAAGRGRRKESDRCAVVFLDERFSWKNYNSILDGGERYVVTRKPEEYVRAFWKE